MKYYSNSTYRNTEYDYHPILPGEVAIPETVYEKLLMNYEILEALVECGVENTPVWDKAMRLLDGGE